MNLNTLVKRVLASIVILFLLAMYIAGFIAAFLEKDYATHILVASIIASTIVPVILYMFRRFHLISNVEIGECEADNSTTQD